MSGRIQEKGAVASWGIKHKGLEIKAELRNQEKEPDKVNIKES